MCWCKCDHNQDYCFCPQNIFITSKEWLAQTTSVSEETSMELTGTINWEIKPPSETGLHQFCFSQLLCPKTWICYLLFQDNVECWTRELIKHMCRYVFVFYGMLCHYWRSSGHVYIIDTIQVKFNKSDQHLSWMAAALELMPCRPLRLEYVSSLKVISIHVISLMTLWSTDYVCQYIIYIYMLFQHISISQCCLYIVLKE